MKGYRTVSQLAAYLGVSTRTVERWYSTGKIPKPALVDDRRWKFWSDEQCREIREWLLDQKKVDRRR